MESYGYNNSQGKICKCEYYIIRRRMKYGNNLKKPIPRTMQRIIKGTENAFRKEYKPA